MNDKEKEQITKNRIVKYVENIFIHEDNSI